LIGLSPPVGPELLVVAPRTGWFVRPGTWWEPPQKRGWSLDVDHGGF